MENNILQKMAELIPLLKDITYSSAKKLLGDISNVKQGSSEANFWTLFSLLWSSNDDDTIQSEISKWLRESINDTIPTDCDPFIRALFLHDESVFSIGASISPYIPLVLSGGKIPKDVPISVPSFLSSSVYKFGTLYIPGKAIWELINGNFDEIEAIDLDTLLSFALYMWYCVGNNDLKSAILLFTGKRKYDGLSKKSDPIFLLLRYFASSDVSISSISSSIPPIDSLFFTVVFSALISKALSNMEIRFVLNLLSSQLFAVDLWGYSAGAYYQFGLIDECSYVIDSHCSDSILLSFNESVLTKSFGFEEKKVYYSKSKKLMYFSYLLPKNEARLEHIAKAIDLALKAEAIDLAHDSLFSHYIPLMSYLGIQDLKALEWSEKLSIHSFQGKMFVDVFMMVSLKKMIQDDFSNLDIQKIASHLRNGWGNFPLRREICARLLTHPGACQFLEGIDALPMDDYLAALTYNK